MTLPLLAVGAVGAVSVASHWVGPELSEMVAAFAKGDTERAREVNAALLDAVAFQSSEAYPNPVPAKAVCRARGQRVGQCRPPHGAGDRRARRVRPVAARVARPSPVSPARWRGPVRIVFLGGLGEIGRNCACIEAGGRIVILDCGVMFPDPDMPGIDFVLPDLSYLRQRAEPSTGSCSPTGTRTTPAASPSCCVTCRPRLRLGADAGPGPHRVEEAGLLHRAEFVEVADGERRRIGPFEVEFIPVTHSVPHGFAMAFHTAQGVILHSGDFKIDLTPVDGRFTDLARIGALAEGPGIRLMMADSTNAEEPGFTESERASGPFSTVCWRRGPTGG